jgi:hypothetical protein
MRRHMALDGNIGWQSEIYDYSYSETLLKDKIRHDRETLKTLARWEKAGIEPGVLTAVLPTPPPPPAPPPPTYQDWLQWGD